MAIKIIDGQVTNRHHERWPRSAYNRKPPPGIAVAVSRRFRNLPCETRQMEIRAHIRLHQTTEPPPMPSEAEMRAVIRAHEQRRCRCFVEDPVPVIVEDPPAKKKKRRKKTTRRSGTFVNRPAFVRA